MMLTIAASEPCSRNNGKPAPRIIGTHACVNRLRSTINAICNRNCTILICGESGSGKELVARQIHAAGPRARGPFITADCTTLRDTLFESQLFGHVKGAFTGADQATLGLFRAADGGTLLLDEVGELEPHIQSKLLRCIEEGAVVPLGAVKPLPVDVRIIAATHRDLKDMVRRGSFREDLYYRLNVVRLDVPPLRDHRSDIIPLAEHFLAQHAEVLGEPVKTLSPDAKLALEDYSWPGNVRELRNVIEHACVFSENGSVTRAYLPAALRQVGNNHETIRHGEITTLEAAERSLIERALRAAGGIQVRAATMLGVERHRLARMIRRHGLEAFTAPHCS